MMFEPLDPDADPATELLRTELIDMILYASRNDARSLQLELGPSEVGHPCDRKLAYRMAGVPEINVESDPWPATVGTAIHAWLAEAVDLWNHVQGTEWRTEQTIQFPEFNGVGHGDLYVNGTVVDWKTSNSDLIKKYRKVGPPPEYITQVQLYGYGYRNQGLEVNRVALAFIPRSGWIKNLWLWTADYDESVATKAIQRLYDVALMAVNLQVPQHPENFNQIEAVPADYCGICPWFSPQRGTDMMATDKGCPGPGY